MRSATQPLGSTAPLEAARLASRLGTVNSGFDRMVEGAKLLEDGLNQGAAKLRTAMMFESMTGIRLTGPTAAAVPPATPTPSADPGAAQAKATAEPGDSLLSGLRQASAGLLGPSRNDQGTSKSSTPATPDPKPDDPRTQMIHELTWPPRGRPDRRRCPARPARKSPRSLADPVGPSRPRPSADHPRHVKEHPELLKSFAAYLSRRRPLRPHRPEQADRMFSAEAMEQVGTLRAPAHGVSRRGRVAAQIKARSPARTPSRPTSGPSPAPTRSRPG